MKNYFSLTDLIVILVTAILFIAAIFLKGLTKDLLLEAGVLLVSIKLILMGHKNASFIEQILKELREIKEILPKVKEENRK